MEIIRLTIYGNLLVSFSVGILTYGVSSLIRVEDRLLIALCASFATLLIYNLQRVLRLDEVQMQSSDRHVWLTKNKRTIISLSVIGALGALTCYLLLGITTDIYLVFLLTLIGFLYAYRGSHLSALRDLPFLKIYLIGIVWTFVCVVWPALRAENWDPRILSIALSVFLYIIAATIPFDIRDLVYDEEKQKTIPQLVGVTRAKTVSVLLLLVSAALLVYETPKIVLNPFIYIAYAGMIILSLLVNERRPEMYFSGWIDGWIIFLGLMFAYQAFL